jgi:hypothetical protein
MLLDAVLDHPLGVRQLTPDRRVEDLLLDDGVDGELTDQVLGGGAPGLVVSLPVLREQLLDLTMVAGEQLGCVHQGPP